MWWTNEAIAELYSDNALGFTSKLLAGYLGAHGIRHLFETPYHPQGRGEIESFNRRIKQKLYRVVSCSSGQLKKAVNETIGTYNSTPHESLNKVSSMVCMRRKRRLS